MVPVVLTCIVLFSGQNLFLGEAYPGLVAIAVFPFLNGLLTVIFIGPYRRFTASLLRSLFRLPNRPSSVVEPTATNVN